MKTNTNKAAAIAICSLTVLGGAVTLKDGREAAVFEVDHTTGSLWVYPRGSFKEIKVPAADVERFH